MTERDASPLTFKRIVRTWWPLAASWILMTSELPLMSAIIARLLNPEINLAAWGIVFAVAVMVQAPGAMLLATSTALSRDSQSYTTLRKYALTICAVQTAIHAVVAFTPLYYVVFEQIIGVPSDIVEPARIGLMLITPWPAGTAYRRFEQGLLIRFERAHVVVWGSALRLTIDCLILWAGYTIGSIDGVIVAALAITIGALSETLYSILQARVVVRTRLQTAQRQATPVTWSKFLNFYTPLALTSLLAMFVQPLVSAALSRMPDPIDSLAVWPVVFGFIMMWQSAGIAYNEVVIALLDAPQAVRRLRRFTWLLIGSLTVPLIIVTASPLALVWFRDIAALNPQLTALARGALWLSLLLPALRVLQNWYQGSIVHSERTRGVTESVVVFLASTGVVLWAGATWGSVTGLYAGIVAYTVGMLLQTGWLWYRSRPALDALKVRDERLAHAAPRMGSN